MTEGVTIVVDRELNRWDAIDEPTPENLELVEILKSMGGVNESVPTGVYKFRVEQLDELLNAIAFLEPVE